MHIIYTRKYLFFYLIFIKFKFFEFRAKLKNKSVVNQFCGRGFGEPPVYRSFYGVFSSLKLERGHSHT